MTQRDSMVIPVDLDPQVSDAGRPVAERRGRRIPGEDRSRRGFGRQLAVLRRKQREAIRKGFMRGSGMGRLLTRGNLVMLATVVGGLTAARLISGRPIQNLGQMFADHAFRGMDRNDKATMVAQMHLGGNTQLMRGVQQESKKGTDVRAMLFPTFNLHKSRARAYFDGVAEATRNPEFTADTTPEQLMLRSQSFIRYMFEEAGGQRQLKELVRALKSR